MDLRTRRITTNVSKPEATHPVYEPEVKLTNILSETINATLKKIFNSEVDPTVRSYTGGIPDDER